MAPVSAAKDLHFGETLLLADDTLVKVACLKPRQARETVYNIEVDGEHVFYVGEHGVLVHNGCDDYFVYVLKDKKGNVKYWGITKQNPSQRALQHLRDGKDFHKMTVIEEGLTRRQARNIEGSALKNARERGEDLLNERRRDGGFYHSYGEKVGRGRRLVTEDELQDLLDNPLWDVFIQ